MPRLSPGEPPVRTLLLILATTASAISVNSLIASSLSEIVAGIGANIEQAGLITGAATLPGILLAPVIGMLSDRYGRRSVLVPCLILFGVAGGLAATSTSLLTMMGWRFLQGIGSAGLINLAVVLIADHWDGPRRATIIGRNVAVLTVCLSLFPLIGGWVTETFGWRAVFLVYPIALLTAVGVATHFAKGERIHIDVVAQLREMGPALRRPGVLPALAATILIFLVISSVVLTVLPIYLAESFRLSPSSRGLVLGLPAIANTAAALSAAHLPFSPKWVLILGASSIALSLLVMSAFGSVGGVVAGMFLFGAGEGVMLPTIQGIVADVGSHSRGAVIALYTSSKNVGQTFGPVIGGFGLGSFGARRTVLGVSVLVVGLLIPMLAKFVRKPALEAGLDA